jgi:hypothetical protein
MVVADRAADHAGGYLLLTRSAVLKPTLKLMSIRTEKIESNHLGLRAKFNTSTPFRQAFSRQGVKAQKIQCFSSENTDLTLFMYHAFWEKISY